MYKFAIVCVAFMCLFGNTILHAEEAKVGSKVSAVEIRTANDEPMHLPKLGKKHLLIFYVDPDHGNQNQAFRENLEKDQINSPDIFAFGVINLKDAPLLPNSVVRAMIRAKIKQTGADIYTDPNYLLRDAWNLGDVNNLFTIIFVNKSQEIEFISKGEMTQEQIDEFFRIIQKYK